MSSEDVSVLATGEISASAGRAQMLVSENIDVNVGGAISASVNGASTEVRGDASLAAAAAASLSGESATLAVSGDLDVAADSVKLSTEAVDVMMSRLESTAAEAASLSTNDATISASGTVSAYATDMQALLEGHLAVESAGDASMRTQTVEIETSEEASLVAKRMVDARTQRLRVRAGVQQNEGKVRVALDCEEMPELCASVRSGSDAEDVFVTQAAELLGVPAQRLVLRSESSPVVEEQTAGRRRTEEMQQQVPVGPSSTGRRRRLETTSTDSGSNVRRPRSHTRLRALPKWSIREVQKWVKSVQMMPGVAQGVARERVDGPMAIELSAADWQELGATRRQGATLASAVRDIVEQGGLPKREMG